MSIEFKGQRPGQDGTDLDDKLQMLAPRFTFKQGEGKKLGTILGVFLPTLQNILGIILFVRLPKITGEAGVGQALGIVLLGCSASFLTSLSMSAVATNGVPKGGGAFSVIKESIGPEFGGTVGCLLFLSNCFGIAMYVLACVEILQLWAEPLKDVNIRLLGALILFGLLAVVYVGISYISKASMLFMAGVMLSIASIYAGVIEHAVNPEPKLGIPGLSASLLGKNMGPGYSGSNSFGVMLAIFFPAVTDPLAGSNLSGDLQDPQGSIPIGTISAVLVTTVIFCLQVVFTGGSCDRDALQADTGGSMVANLAWPVVELVYVGMLMSTLGAGLQSLAGAPRLLAAIGKIKLIPEFAMFSPKPGCEPKEATLFCAGVAFCAVMIGKLDMVAPFITMWFLTCYGIINGACAYLAYERIPSFRPTFKHYDWRLSLLGAVQCFSMMLYCAPAWYFAVLAIAVAVGVYKYVQSVVGLQAMGRPTPPFWARGKQAHSERVAAYDLEASSSSGGGGGKEGDWRSGRRFLAARESLLSLKQGDMDFKYWRPFILFLASVHEEEGTYVPQGGMIHLIQQLMKRSKGLSIVAGVIEGTFEEKHLVVEKARDKLGESLKERGIEGFPEIITAPNRYEGYKTLVTAEGLGSLRPNTVMLGWPARALTNVEGGMSERDQEAYADLCGYVALAKKTLLICKGTEMFPASDPERVGSGSNAGLAVAKGKSLTGFMDVWWIFDLFPSNGLMLLLPYLLQQHKVWRKCTTRLFAVAAPSTDLAELKKLLAKMISAGGIVVQIEVLHMDPNEATRFAANTRADPAPDLAASDLKQVLSMEVLKSQGSASSPRQSEAPNPSAATISGDSGNAAAEAAAATTTTTKKKGGVGGSGIAGLLAEHSGESPLVVITLPKRRPGQSAGEWLAATQELAAPLKRCIFVQESGHEKIQFIKD